MIFLLPDLLAPSCKVVPRGGRARKELKSGGSEMQVSAEVKQSFLALLLSCLLLAWPWVEADRDLLTCLKQLCKPAV